MASPTSTEREQAPPSGTPHGALQPPRHQPPHASVRWTFTRIRHRHPHRTSIRPDLPHTSPALQLIKRIRDRVDLRTKLAMGSERAGRRRVPTDDPRTRTPRQPTGGIPRPATQLRPRPRAVHAHPAPSRGLPSPSSRPRRYIEQAPLRPASRLPDRPSTIPLPHVRRNGAPVGRTPRDTPTRKPKGGRTREAQVPGIGEFQVPGRRRLETSAVDALLPLDRRCGAGGFQGGHLASPDPLNEGFSISRVAVPTVDRRSGLSQGRRAELLHVRWLRGRRAVALLPLLGGAGGCEGRRVSARA